MFNAIFGNFLFSRAAAQPEPTQTQEQTTSAAVEASTQTSLTASISTQTICHNEPALDCSLMATSTATGGLAGKKPAEEWVIVDPTLEQADKLVRAASTEDKGCQGENLVEMQEQPAEVMQCTATTQSDAVVVQHDDQEAEEEEEEDDDDVMLGSFFDRHAHDDDDVKMAKSSCVDEDEQDEEDIAQEFEEKNPVKIESTEEPTITKEEETWLITPLPCLTSITSSQRSIVENGTLENLLIEHPSMSIFMSATQSASASSIRSSDDEDAIYEADYQAHRKLEQKQKQKKAGKKEELRQQIQAKKAAAVVAAAAAAAQQPKPVVITQVERTQFGTKTFASVLKEKQHAVQEPLAKPIAAKMIIDEPVVAVKQVESVAPVAKPVSVVIVKSVAEKRKESDKCEMANLSAGSSSESLSSASSGSGAVSSKAKKEKKNKKSASSSPANKENLQVRTLLFSDMKKASVSGRGLDLTNKNQMKRNNKNALFSKTNVSSKKQRKYHNLQQPSFSYGASNQQF